MGNGKVLRYLKISIEKKGISGRADLKCNFIYKNNHGITFLEKSYIGIIHISINLNAKCCEKRENLFG